MDLIRKKHKLWTNFNILNLSKVLLLLTMLNICIAETTNNALKDLTIENLDKEYLKITLQFSMQPKMPRIFAIDKSKELIVDFPDTISELPKHKMRNLLSLEYIKSINITYANNKVRMSIKVKDFQPYTLDINENNIIIMINNEGAEKNTITNQATDDYTITELDFNRGPNGEGKLILDLNFAINNVEIQENNDEKNDIIINFKNATIPDKLLRNFDVSDFGTPMKNIIFSKLNNDLILNIKTKGEHEKITYHLDGKYIVEARSKDSLIKQLEKTRKFKFTGEKISLNFQDIEIRAILQLLADFTGLNIIANDRVNGNVTLRLDNIPWDQALDFILKSKGLTKRESGNIILIGPTEEISKYEEMELSSLKQIEALAPIKTEYIKINYAKAEEVIKMIKDDEKNSMLSSRGNISFDARTNTLLLKEIEDRINDIKELIKILDVPIKQVLIEAYIVSASESFEDNFGVNLNTSAGIRLGNKRLGLSKTADEALKIANDGIGAMNGIPSNLVGFGGKSDGNVSLGMALSKLPGGILLSLELQALETESLGTVIAKPKILTLDKQSASIEAGQDIPYISSSNNSGTTTTFQKAAIRLQVTPQITPNNQISMDISINNDSPGAVLKGIGGADNTTVPINTNTLKTNIVIEDGETIVLGGLIKEDFQESMNKIPYFSQIPILGLLFKNKQSKLIKSELLVFITPRIITTEFKEPHNNDYQ